MCRSCSPPPSVDQQRTDSRSWPAEIGEAMNTRATGTGTWSQKSLNPLRPSEAGRPTELSKTAFPFAGRTLRRRDAQLMQRSA